MFVNGISPASASPSIVIVVTSIVSVASIIVAVSIIVIVIIIIIMVAIVAVQEQPPQVGAWLWAALTVCFQNFITRLLTITVILICICVFQPVYKTYTSYNVQYVYSLACITY